MNAKRQRHPRARARRGYVLVVTLALLVLATSLLVGVGRAALRHAMKAHVAQEELQRRWGAASCRSAVLPHAEAILAAREWRRHAPQPRISAKVQLGGDTFELIIADEQAKANLNVLLADATPAMLENRLRQAFSGTGAGAWVKLRPSIFQPPKQQGVASTQSVVLPTVPAPRWLSGPGQVFDNPSPERLLTPAYGGVAPGDLTTCWGGGALNLRRASEASLKLAGPALTTGQVRKLLDARDAGFAAADAPALHPAPSSPNVPENPMEQTLKTAGIGLRERRGLAPLVAASACHSLWVVCHTKRRAWYDFTVLDSTDEQHPRTYSFSW